MFVRSMIAGLALTVAASHVAAQAAPAAAPAPAGLTEWTIDPSHTTVGFTVPHMVVSEVDGQFKQYKGQALLDEKNLQNSKVSFTIEAASVETGDKKRDEHLRSAEFFDTAKFPQLTFKSTGISKSGAGYTLKGDLTIHGVTKPVTLTATVSDAVASPWGNLVRAVKITGKIKRADFGLNWNKALDKGGVVVGDTVDLNLKLELNRPAAQKSAAAEGAAPAPKG
jgi:polyisoprenoid-binding protein YceI